MKHLSLLFCGFLSCLVVLTACKKSKDTPEQNVAVYDTHNGKIKEMSGGNCISHYDYDTKGRLVRTSTLNGNGIPTGAYILYDYSDPTKVVIDCHAPLCTSEVRELDENGRWQKNSISGYNVYNVEGYLIKRWCPQNGVESPSYITFILENGNAIKEVYHELNGAGALISIDTLQTYTFYKDKENSINHVMNGLLYVGKSNKNLLYQSYYSNILVETHTYGFDEKGRVKTDTIVQGTDSLPCCVRTYSYYD